tara:strand:- start:106 stop:1131 length:1026 start_codon:yes stop_codon:yes gene_type:complete
MLRIFGEIYYLNYIYLLISSILPFIFFKILSTKFQADKNYLFLISLIIFLSPYFRSSAVWLLGENLSLIFFSLFTFFYIKSKSTRKFSDYLISAFFIILCSYVRYYYCLFFLILLLDSFKNLSLKNFLYFIFFCFVFSFLGFIYFLIIFFNFNFTKTLSVFGGINYINNICTIYLIILFYLIPILIFKIKEIIKYYTDNRLILYYILSICFSVFLLDHFFYKELIFFNEIGGGVIKKLLALLDIENDFLYFLPLIISSIFLDYIFKDDRYYNYLIFLIIILSLSLNVIFQKYLDPLFILILFGLVNSNTIHNILNNKLINLKIFFLYFSSFLIFANLHYAN